MGCDVVPQCMHFLWLWRFLSPSDSFNQRCRHTVSNLKVLNSHQHHSENVRCQVSQCCESTCGLHCFWPICAICIEWCQLMLWLTWTIALLTSTSSVLLKRPDLSQIKSERCCSNHGRSPRKCLGSKSMD